MSSTSGGAGIQSVGFGDLVAGNEIYDTAGVNPCAASALAGVTVSVPNGFSCSLAWDTQTFKMQFLDNVVHDSGMTAAANFSAFGCTGAHTDGHGVCLDIDQRASPTIVS